MSLTNPNYENECRKSNAHFFMATICGSIVIVATQRLIGVHKYAVHQVRATEEAVEADVDYSSGLFNRQNVSPQACSSTAKAAASSFLNTSLVGAMAVV